MGDVVAQGTRKDASWHIHKCPWDSYYQLVCTKSLDDGRRLYYQRRNFIDQVEALETMVLVTDAWADGHHAI